MKRWNFALYTSLMFVLFSSPLHVFSQSKYVVTDVKGSMISIDSTFDVRPDKRALAIVRPYKSKITKLMTTQIGVSSQTMEDIDGYKEGLLSNLVADVLRKKGTEVSGKSCDMGLINKGGIRSILPKGKIMVSNIYEILPFENTLCVLTLNGTQLKSLMEDIARTRGQGVSGVKMVISKDGKLIDATVNNKPIDPNKSYLLATINYLAEGNDGLKTLARKDVQRVNYDNLTLRDIFMKYVKAQTALGKKISSSIDGRVKFVD